LIGTVFELSLTTNYTDMKITKLVFAAIVLCTFSFSNCKKSSTDTQGRKLLQSVYSNLEYKPDVPGIETNPLKGFVPYTEQVNDAGNLSDFPFSMEFFYFPLKDVMQNINQFNWTKVEEALNKIKSRNNHATFRFYLDYPGSETGTPQFLINAGVPMRDYNAFDNNNKSKAPDWNNSILMDALVNFIGAFGQKYDGDPRIAYLTLGLYGFWGEWHTWPYDGFTSGNADWQMTEANKTRLLNSFKNSFTKTFLHLRTSTAVSDKSLVQNFGFHDDSYCYQTLPNADFHFVTQLQKSGTTEQWKQKPIGGELRPEIWPTIFNTWDNRENNAQSIVECNGFVHPTWMMYAWIYSKSNNPTAVQKSNALKQQKLMGYELYVSKVKIADSASNGLVVSTTLQNKGLAPLYYNWGGEFFAYDVANKKIVKKLGDADMNWPQILPDNKEYERTNAITADLSKGSYQLLFRIKNPLSDARPIRFANSTQDQHETGYLSLGSFEIK
jgi:hypothetical protein